MTSEQILLFALFGAVFGLLLWGKFRYDLVAFGALMLAVVLGVVPERGAFDGFGHPATLVVALVLVVSAGLVRSGAVFLITRTLVDAPRSRWARISRSWAGSGGAVGLHEQRRGAGAADAGRHRRPRARRAAAPGLTLMPLSFATILGGMATLIGTPPNIIIATIREDSARRVLRGMFDFAPVGGAHRHRRARLRGLVGWRLIPARKRRCDAADPLDG
jgi:di/tricarboxylate transporter